MLVQIKKVYMAVTNNESQLPPDVEEEIEPNLKNDLRRKSVAEVFFEADRPYLETSHVKERVDSDYTRDTVSSRLNELVDAGVLRKDSTGNADQYWIANDHSYWMIPDDVVVISNDTPEAITLNDLLNDRPSRNLGWGILISAISGAMVTGLSLLAAVINASGIIQTTLTSLIAVALVGAMVGAILCISSIGKAVLSDQETELNKILPF